MIWWAWPRPWLLAVACVVGLVWSFKVTYSGAFQTHVSGSQKVIVPGVVVLSAVMWIGILTLCGVDRTRAVGVGSVCALMEGAALVFKLWREPTQPEKSKARGKGRR